MITKSDDRAAGVRFVYHEHDYKPRSYYQLIIKITISKKNGQVMKESQNLRLETEHGGVISLMSL